MFGLHKVNRCEQVNRLNRQQNIYDPFNLIVDMNAWKYVKGILKYHPRLDTASWVTGFRQKPDMTTF